MATTFTIVYVLTALSLFRHYPSDEATVRAAVIGVAYVCAYVVLRAAVRLVQRYRRNGRGNLPKV